MTSTAKIVLERAELEKHLADWRTGGLRIVLTNGAFDLLHVGHIRALEAARTHGDVLAVGLNSDISVRANKGEGRPVVPEAERAEVLAALACVDLVTIFTETTAEDLVRVVRPHVYAKGRDYRAESLPELAAVREVGAKIVLVGDSKNHAASDLIARIRGTSGAEERA